MYKPEDIDKLAQDIKEVLGLDQPQDVIKIKKLHPDALIPEYQTQYSAGFDLTSIGEFTLLPQETKLIPTGIAIELPKTSSLFVCSRSGLALKNNIIVLNAPGIVDSDYRGEIKVILKNLGDTEFKISKGDRIAQGVVVSNIIQHQFQEVESLNETTRGENGFGSTGVQSQGVKDDRH